MNKYDANITKILLKLVESTKYVLLSYLLYLILPPLVLMRYTDYLEAFSNALESNIDLAERLINDIILYHLLYAIIYGTTLLLLAIAIINQYTKTQKLNNNLELELNQKISKICLIWPAYAITLSIIVIILATTQINALRTQLINSLTKQELTINIETEPIRTLIIIHEILFSLTIIIYGFSLTEIQANYEIFQPIKTPGTILVIGGTVFLLETSLIGIRIGPILILLGFYLTRKRFEKIKMK